MAAVARSVGRLSSQRSILFLCDMQDKFRKMIQYFPEIVSVSNRMLQASKILNIPVVATEQYPKGLGKTVEELGLDGSVPIFEKTQFSMCIAEVLDHMNTKYPDADQVLLCGLEAHVCVLNTALNLLEQGKEVHIIVDACSSRTMTDRKYAFERMKQSGAFLTTSEAAILGLVGGSGHPNFRDAQKIIMNSAPDTGLLTWKPSH